MLFDLLYFFKERKKEGIMGNKKRIVGERF